MTSGPLWTPSATRIARSNMTAFIGHVAASCDPDVVDYDTLHAFSVTRPAAFYDALWHFFSVIGEEGTDIVIDPERMPGASWFPKARLNYAENHLRRRDDGIAIIARTEDGSRRTLSWGELYDQVSSAAQELAGAGVASGDRVAACLPNVPEAIIAMLATASLGAIWSCCPTDSAEQLLIDRIGQITPKVFVVADGYRYEDKLIRSHEKTEGLIRAMPSIERVIVVPFAGLDDPLPRTGNAVRWNDFVAPYAPRTIAFSRLPFDHPLWILYSSGTTGKPKAIVHGAGASMLQGFKSIALHQDLQRDERVFYYTSTGWMVWNLMLGALGIGAQILLYEGSPVYPKPSALLDLVAEERVSVVRIVPSLIDAYIRADLFPAQTLDLAALKCVSAGGAPLLPHHCDFVYSRMKSDVHLMSPSGGTDILGEFVTGNPNGPVFPGEIQVPSLGMSVEIFDENGKPIAGCAGELVCTKAFPSMPLGFWGEPDNDRYMNSYFAMYPGVWRQGDWAQRTVHGGFTIFGRADATLNVNGVRIGTSEIYRGLESVREVKDAVAVAQRKGESERIVLFVLMTDGVWLDEALRQRIRMAVRDASTARHVPARIVQTPDLPRSLNGKSSEIAVRDIIHGRAVAPHGLSNPDSLDFFRDIPELRAWN